MGPADSIGRAGLRRFIRLFPATMLAFFIATASPSAHPGPTLRAIGTATVDGVMAPGEWGNAARLDVTLNVENGTTPGTFLAMSDEQNVYFALLATRSTVARSEFFGVISSNLHDNVGPARDYVAAGASSGSVVAFDQFVPTDQGSRDDTADGGSHDVVAAMKNDGASTFFEISHPLDSADDRHDFSLPHGSLMALDMNYSIYPTGGPPAGHQTWLGDVHFLAAPRVPRLTIGALQVDGQYAESEFSGHLLVEGSVNDAVPLVISLRRSGAEAFWEVETEVVSEFSLDLSLPTRLFPGRYIARIQPKVAGVQAQEREVVIPAPKEGVVADMSFSASRSGPAVDAFPQGTKQIWARFRFAAQPKSVCTKKKVTTKVRVGGRVRTRTKTVQVCRPPILVTWFGPGELRGGQSVSKPNVPTVVSAVLSSGPLPAGVWRAIMTVGGVVVKSREIRVG